MITKEINGKSYQIVDGWSYGWTDNLIITPKGIKIKLPIRIYQFVVKSGLFIGITVGSSSPPANNENVYAFQENGELAWQIEKHPETSSSPSYYYKNFDLDYSDEQLIKLFNWNGCEVFVEASTGQIKNVINTLPGWRIDWDAVFCPNQVQVKMPYRITDYTLIQDKLLVFVFPPPGSGILYSENAFLISPAGEILWQVAPIIENMHNVSGGYRSAYIEDDNTIRLLADMVLNYVDINTGKSLKTENTR